MQKLDLLESITKAISDKTDTSLAMNKECFQTMRRDAAALKMAIFEATEVQVPTSFVILNYKIEVESSRAESDITASREKADGWLQSLTKFVCNTTSSACDFMENAKQVVDECVQKFLTDQTLYFYYVDELTMRPMVVDLPDYKYPFEITKPSEKIRSMLPLLKTTLAGVKLLNTAGGIARLFGYPVPCVDDSVFSSAKISLDRFKDASSVASFGVVQSGVDSAQVKSELRGADLRELKLFFNEYDAKGVFAGMCRVCDSDGRACWTTETGKEWLQLSREEQRARAIAEPLKWKDYKLAVFGEEELKPEKVVESPDIAPSVISSSVRAQVSDRKSVGRQMASTSTTATNTIDANKPSRTTLSATDSHQPFLSADATVTMSPSAAPTNRPLFTTPADLTINTHFSDISLEAWLTEEIRPRDPGKVREYLTALTERGGFDDFYDLCHEYMDGSVDVELLVGVGIDEKGAQRMVGALESRANLAHVEYEKGRRALEEQFHISLRQLESDIPRCAASLPIQPKRKEFNLESTSNRHGTLASDMMRSPSRSTSSNGKSEASTAAAAAAAAWEQLNPASSQRLASGKSRSTPSTPQRYQSPVHSSRGARSNPLSMAVTDSEPTGESVDGPLKAKSNCVIL